jgi:hypothetical protein
MNYIKPFNESSDDMSLEERRLERLRNLLSPFLFLPELIEKNEDGKFDKMIQDTAKTCKDIEELVRKCLSEHATLDELNNLID